jgi:hypothetical protein
VGGFDWHPSLIFDAVALDIGVACGAELRRTRREEDEGQKSDGTFGRNGTSSSHGRGQRWTKRWTKRQERSSRSQFLHGRACLAAGCGQWHHRSRRGTCLPIARCPLLVAHCLLPIAYCALLPAPCSLPPAHCSLLTAHYSLLTRPSRSTALPGVTRHQGTSDGARMGTA